MKVMKVSMKRENKLKKLNQKNLLPRKKNQMISPRPPKRATRKLRLQEDVVVVEGGGRRRGGKKEEGKEGDEEKPQTEKPAAQQ